MKQAVSWNRTSALSFTRRLLCPLSYIAVGSWSGRAGQFGLALHGRDAFTSRAGLSRAPSVMAGEGVEPSTFSL